MQINGVELTTIQKGNWRLKSRLISLVPRTPQFRALVNGSGVTDSASGSTIAIIYDTITLGAYTDIQPGMTLDIGTTPGGRERGSIRVRSAPFVGMLYVQQTAPGILTIQDNDYLTVVEEYLPWLIPVRRVEVIGDAGVAVDFTEYHDYDIAYSDQNSHIDPKANIVAALSDDGQGYYLPKLAEWADDGVDYRTVTVTSVASKAIAHGATITGVLWRIGDCTLTVGTLTSTTITFRVPVGCRYISLTVTDSNGNTHTIRLPFWTHDDTYMPLTDFRITQDDTEDGRSMRFEFYGADSSVSPTVLPRNSTILFWKVATFGLEADAAPRQYRGQTLLWIIKDVTTLRHRRRGTYVVDAGGTADWAKSVYGSPQTIRNPGETPNVWYEMQKINGVRLLYYVLKTYTTLLDIVNVFLPDQGDEIEEFNTKAGTVWSQLADIAKRAGYHNAACDSLGGLWMKADYFFLSTGQRAARLKTFAFTPAHFPMDTPPEIADEQLDEIGQALGYGSTYNPAITEGEKSAIFGVRAPGFTQHYGKGRDTAPYQTLPLTDPSLTLQRWTGEFYARRNNRRKQVRVKLIPDLDIIEPAWNEPITITDTRGNLRALLLSGDEFIVKKVSVQHNYEHDKPPEVITLMLEGVTTGTGATPFTIPTDSTLPPPSAPPYNPPPIGRGGNGLSGLVDRIACFDQTNKIHTVSGLRQLANGIRPTTSTATLTSTWGALGGFAVKANSPLYVAGSGAVNAYLAGRSGALIISDLFGSRTLGSVQAYATTGVQQVQLQTERGNANSGIVILYYDVGGSAAYYTSDGGSSWSAGSGLPTNYDTNYVNNTPNWIGGLFVAPSGNGYALTSGHTATGNPPGSAFYESADGGATWALVVRSGWTIDNYNARCITRPLQRPDDVLFFGNTDIIGNPVCRLFRIIGTTRTDISPSVGGKIYGVTLSAAQRAISVADDDPNAVVLVGNDNTGASGEFGVFQTFNGLSASPTWTPIVMPATNVPWRGVYYVDATLAFLFGASGWIGVLKFQNNQWRLYSYQIPGAGDIVGLCGG